MKISYKHQAKEVKNGDSCAVTEHKVDAENHIDCAIATIHGRYPNSGRVTNQKCKELAYVCEGAGQITIEDKDITLSAGDAILIEPGEKYFWNGQMKLFISCTPAWYPEQHTHCD